MKKLHLIFGLFLSIALLASSCKKTATENTSTTSKIENYLSELEKNGFNGTVLVAHEGEKILAKGYGYSDKANKTKATPNTVYDIGSITKQFTAAGILKLEMQGKLSVDDNISKYFKNLPEDKQDITIHQLLTHTSGLRSAVGDDYEAITSDEFVQLAMSKPIDFQDVSHYDYSNVGYSILTLIIEKVAGTTYENYLYENLWKPAGMEQTGYTRPNFEPSKVAIGYSDDEVWGKPNEKKWDTDAPFLHLKGNGGVLSTVEDMYKWHEALLKEEVLSADAKAKYFKKHVEEGDGSNSYYAYGWAIFPTPRQTELIAHNGGNGIFFADMWRYLTEDITIIIMTNSANRASEQAASQIAGIILKPDFEPSLGNKGNDLDESKINGLAKGFMEAIQSENAKDWQAFLENNATQNFIEYADMEQHLEYFGDFHNQLKGGEIATIDVSDQQIKLAVQTKDGTKKVKIGYVGLPDGNIKFEGLQVE